MEMKKIALGVLLGLELILAEGLSECKGAKDYDRGCVKISQTPYGGKIFTPYKNGKINGLQKIYDSEGRLEQTTPYKNGKINGVLKGYADNKVRSTTPYKNGKINGVEKVFYKNGVLKRETPYKNGKINGFERGYYENGKPESIVFYTNGRKDRGGKWYDEKGKILAEFIFKNNLATIGRCYQKKMMSKKQLKKLNNSFYTSTILSICK
ncbi:hypothetical protein CQA58_03725 [Helicobacter brantae]|uniref:Toxin-antitoxin system YwqK family antitoxin n=2 Tax=Helicobacter brantae TaxID=375927 RepID=A0A3D8J112_9HELI|nr:hypothetical protein CQA58_03725 [Helicobacter brantae]